MTIDLSGCRCGPDPGGVEAAGVDVADMLQVARSSARVYGSFGSQDKHSEFPLGAAFSIRGDDRVLERLRLAAYFPPRHAAHTTNRRGT